MRPGGPWDTRGGQALSPATHSRAGAEPGRRAADREIARNSPAPGRCGDRGRRGRRFGKRFAKGCQQPCPRCPTTTCSRWRRSPRRPRVSPTVVLDLAARGSLPTVGPGPLSLESLVARDARHRQRPRPGQRLDRRRRDARGRGRRARGRRDRAGVPVLVSTGLHGLAALAIAVVASLGWSLRADAPARRGGVPRADATRLPRAARPGRWRRRRRPAPEARRRRRSSAKATHSLSSPLPGARAAAPGADRKAARSARSRRPSSRRSPRRPADAADDAWRAARGASGARAHAGPGRWRWRRHRPGRRPRRRQRLGHRRRLGRRHGRRALPAGQRRRTAAAAEGSEGEPTRTRPGGAASPARSRWRSPSGATAR